MVLKLYSIFDFASEDYSTPFTAPTDKVAKRIFREQLKRLPDEYSDEIFLFCLGEFSSSTGSIVPMEAVQICSYQDLKDSV